MCCGLVPRHNHILSIRYRRIQNFYQTFPLDAAPLHTLQAFFPMVFLPLIKFCIITLQTTQSSLNSSRHSLLSSSWSVTESGVSLLSATWWSDTHHLASIRKCSLVLMLIVYWRHTLLGYRGNDVLSWIDILVSNCIVGLPGISSIDLVSRLLPSAYMSSNSMNSSSAYPVWVFFQLQHQLWLAPNLG